MICADFLAGATLDEANPAIFSVSIRRLAELLPKLERLEFIRSLKGSAGIVFNRNGPGFGCNEIATFDPVARS